MNILAIASSAIVLKDGTQITIVHGLGNDNNLYKWSWKNGEWLLDKPVQRNVSSYKDLQHE